MVAAKAGDVFHARRLTGAAERQIADADDRRLGSMNAPPAAVKHPVPQTRRPAVGDRGKRKPSSRQIGSDAARLPTHEGEVTIFGKRVRWRIKKWRNRGHRDKSYSPKRRKVSIGVGRRGMHGRPPPRLRSPKFVSNQLPRAACNLGSYWCL